MELNAKHIFFLGIGGIGMSALALYFHRKGVEVSGYDRTCTALTQSMEREGINISYIDTAENIPDTIDLVVLTPAVPNDNLLLAHFRSAGIKILKRSEVLGLLSNDFKTIAVAGTHGKTSTTALITHLLVHSGKEITSFVGGIMAGYETNFFSGRDEWMVAEADEFDRSFLKLNPTVTVLNSLDADHLDIYGSVDEMRKSYAQFLLNIKEGGVIFIKDDLIELIDSDTLGVIRKKARIISFGYNHWADVRIVPGIHNEYWSFDLEIGGNVEVENLVSTMPGYHNLLNSTAAYLVARNVGLSVSEISEGLTSFKGIHRRFDKKYDDGSNILIDDYAHHPEEISMLYSGLRRTYPNRKLMVIFQPHLYSRTRDFADKFAAELDRFDQVVLMDIYPARELPLEGVSSELICSMMENKSAAIKSVEEILDIIYRKDLKDWIVLTVGAGDIDLLPAKIVRIFEHKIQEV